MWVSYMITKYTEKCCQHAYVVSNYYRVDVLYTSTNDILERNVMCYTELLDCAIINL